MLDRTTRRRFLQQATLASLSALAPLEALAFQVASTGQLPQSEGYGPLFPVADEVTGLPLLQLPKGFRYRSLAWTGDRLSDGSVMPGAPDGMAAFAGRDGHVHLVRNHELDPGPAFGPTTHYDARGGGGTTTLVLDAATGLLRASHVSLSGTLRNCAGGPTPWNSWLTCEETVLGPDSPGSRLERPHGFIFDVPAEGTPTGEPLMSMGRFSHEAVAVDPRSGVVYETEDADRAGLYRFTPTTPGQLARGGRLEMLAVDGRPQHDLRGHQQPGTVLPVRWVPVAEPTRAHAPDGPRRGDGVFMQGWQLGGAMFARLEGATYREGRVLVTSTSGGAVKMGQVWELDIDRQQLRLVFESPSAEVMNMPDNLTVSPRGGVALCEDGTANPCVHGLTREGRVFRFARNNVRLNGEHGDLRGDFTGSEFAGAAYSPDGRWLFVNIQRPGVTLAITGPWGDGLL